jgi:hypothetical protein
MVEQATVSQDGREIRCPEKRCELRIGLVVERQYRLLPGYRIDSARRMWIRQPYAGRPKPSIPRLGDTVKCCHCGAMMAWPFGGASQQQTP